mmetsp:Transcript_349/g.455  ORF Transcript_349/g.455 Transcript_349/m.455 type:complete len:81 (-) Transcript_349:252-494(-)
MIPSRDSTEEYWTKLHELKAKYLVYLQDLEEILYYQQHPAFYNVTKIVSPCLFLRKVTFQGFSLQSRDICIHWLIPPVTL